MTSSALAITGRLQIFECHPLPGHTLLIPVVDTHNLVVDVGLSILSRFLGRNRGAPLVGGTGFSDIDDLTIDRMQLGSTSAPAAPVAGDTTGVGTLLPAFPLTVSYPTTTSIRFSSVIPIGELVGTTITEEALLTINSKVFAKTTFSIRKTGSAALQFVHTINFARG